MATRKTTAKRKTAVRSAPTILKAEVGRFDGELKTVAFNDGDTVQAVLSKAGYDLSTGESLTDDRGDDVALSDKAKATTYLITGNYKNGNL